MENWRIWGKARKKSRLQSMRSD